MHRRDLLLTTAAAAVTLPILPRPLLAASPPDFPWEKQTAEILGSTMAYVDEGTGRPIVFLHGNPTSSYLWRGVLPYVMSGHRVIASDLIGMGESGKPDIDYTYADHAAYLHAFLDTLDLQDVVLVIHDWGSALGLDWARRNPERVSAVAFMEALLPPAFPFPSYEAMGPLGEIFKAWRTPGVGERMILEDNMFIEEMLGKQAVAVPLSRTTLDVYNSYYATPAERAPLLQWPREIPIGGEPAANEVVVHTYSEWFLGSDIPKLLFYADPGAIMPPEAVEWIAANTTNIETVFLGAGVHFLQEDHPDAIGQALADWLTRL